MRRRPLPAAEILDRELMSATPATVPAPVVEIARRAGYSLRTRAEMRVIGRRLASLAARGVLRREVRKEGEQQWKDGSMHVVRWVSRAYYIKTA